MSTLTLGPESASQKEQAFQILVDLTQSDPTLPALKPVSLFVLKSLQITKSTLFWKMAKNLEQPMSSSVLCIGLVLGSAERL